MTTERTVTAVERTNEPNKDDSSIRVPLWAVAIVGAAAMSVMGWTATTVITLRETDVRVEERIVRLEDRARVVDVFAQSLNDMKSDLKLLTAEVGRLREDLGHILAPTQRK